MVGTGAHWCGHCSHLVLAQLLLLFVDFVVDRAEVLECGASVASLAEAWLTVPAPVMHVHGGVGWLVAPRGPLRQLQRRGGLDARVARGLPLRAHGRSDVQARARALGRARRMGGGRSHLGRPILAIRLDAAFFTLAQQLRKLHEL